MTSSPHKRRWPSTARCEMCGFLAMIIGLSTILGKLLAESGAAEVIANPMVRLLEIKRLDYTVMPVALDGLGAEASGKAAAPPPSWVCVEFVHHAAAGDFDAARDCCGCDTRG